MIQLGHTPGQAPRLESLGVGVAPEPRVAVPSVAFQLPPELLGPTGGDFVGQRGDIPERNNVTLREDRDYREVSVSSTGAVHGQCSADGERGDDELPWVEAVVPVRSEEMGLPVDEGDQWEDEPDGLEWGVEGM